MDSPESKLLRATLAQMADRTGNYIAVTFLDGDDVAEPIISLGVTLGRDDQVGPLLAKAQAGLVSSAKSAVGSMVLQHTFPVWATALVVFISPLVLGLYTAGANFGGALVKGIVPGALIYGLIRVVQAASPGVVSLHESIWSWVNTVGNGANRLIGVHVEPVLADLKLKGLTIPSPPRPIIHQVRSAGRLAVGLSYTALFTAILIFLVGFSAAVT